VWPFLLTLGLRWLPNRRRLGVAVLGLAALSALEMAWLFRPGADPSRVYYGTDTRAFSLLMGAALALWWPSRSLAARRGPRLVARLNAVGILGLAVVLALFVFSQQTSPFLYRGGMVLLSAAALAVVAAAAHPATWLGRMLSGRALTWVGVRSYGLYLWHYPIIILTTPLGASPNLLRASLQVAAAVTAAALSWRYLEEPIRRGSLSHFARVLRAQHWHLERVPQGGRAASAGVALTMAVGLSVAGLAGLVPGSQGMSTATAILPPIVRAVSTPAAPRPHPVVPHGPGPGIRVQAPLAGGLPPAARVGPRLPAGAGVTVIGDSVMVDVGPYLEKLLPGIVVDAVVGRQMYEAPAVVTWLKAHHDLGRRVFVVELGTNGSFTHAQILQVLRDAGPVQHIILINTRMPRSWEGAVNAGLLWAAAHYPHTVVVNWYAYSANHPNWFWPDDVHPDPEGSAAYARLVAHAVLAAEGVSTPKP
jgi:hypothetical protein